MGAEEEEIELEGGSTLKTVLLIVGALVVVIAIIGTVAAWAGVGFLGHRIILHGDGELYVLNLTGEERYVSVDGREKKVIHARDAQIAELIGGRSKVEIFSSEGELWKSFDVQMSRSHVLINISEQACLVVTDISTLYQGDEGGVHFQAFLQPDQEVYELGSRNVVWPRRSPPPRMDASLGPMLSVEIVGCSLLDDESFLKEYLIMRLQDRMKSGDS